MIYLKALYILSGNIGGLPEETDDLCWFYRVFETCALRLLDGRGKPSPSFTRQVQPHLQGGKAACISATTP
jgi:hypothetical protein